MEQESTSNVEAETPVGATTDLPHDRITVQRFRQSFPRARWSDRPNAWFVPGRTAGKRIGRWLAQMEAEADAFAEEKGMDAFAFDPIESRYLEAAASGLQLRTPYSRTVVTEIREIPLARWDQDRRLWTVPYRSLDDLRQRWLAIQEAAERNEPDVRKARREALKGTEEEVAAKGMARERRLKRYPVPIDDVPPFDRAIGTHAGVVIFTDTHGELADPDIATTFYFHPPSSGEYVWAAWRPGSLEELVTTWPARTPPGEREIARGWWLPDLDELRPARQKARSKRRAQQRRQEDQGRLETPLSGNRR
ncbi:hypothetical protein HFC70_21985 [Agrobacterium sp. a22-2]|uniref:hypothetical protein n=1 Tax=Agrobacterium sp. a22-2 TaxID=2283840 RepID=UPI0014459EB3|nr:hypothetical protein [Agrobacterium sp. a22-2]NKN39023.1 hypothetical protein [Agrobacterium sp. a22-2]